MPIIEQIWIDRAQQQHPEMSESEARFFCEMKQKNDQHISIFRQKVRAFRRLIKLAKKGNEYAASVLRDLPRWGA